MINRYVFVPKQTITIAQLREKYSHPLEAIEIHIRGGDKPTVYMCEVFFPTSCTGSAEFFARGSGASWDDARLSAWGAAAHELMPGFEVTL